MTSPAPALLPLVQALATRQSQLHDDLHPAWSDAAWQRLSAQSNAHWNAPGGAAELARHLSPRRRSHLLAQALGLRWPPLPVLSDRSHRLALLPRPALLRVLAACALQGRRESIRRAIGRVVRELLIEGIGAQAYQAVLNTQTAAPQMAVNASVTDTDPLQISELDQEQLAVQGFRQLCAAGGLPNPRLRQIVGLSLHPDALRGAPSAEAIFSSSPLAVLDHLPDYFPEFAWLFGSDMDRALWASSTASCAGPTSRH